uniref:Uncharacterized protein n=1 Tax=Caenorhabditis japonica TaxID=281687 RepID=A0A8R1HLK8_CAEJA
MERNDIVTAVNELAATVNAMRLEDHRDYARGDQSRERFRRYDNSRHRYSSRDYSRERHPRREHSRHQPPARDHSKDRSSKKDNFRRQSPESEPRRDRNHYRRDNSRQWRRDENRPNRGRSIHKAKTNFLFASVVMALVSLSACETFYDCNTTVGGIFIATPTTNSDTPTPPSPLLQPSLEYVATLPCPSWIHCVPPGSLSTTRTKKLE